MHACLGFFTYSPVMIHHHKNIKYPYITFTLCNVQFTAGKLQRS